MPEALRREPFADHFSGHADIYARYRPRYPDALFDHIANLCPAREIVWDCGTGNGQAAVGLAARFAHVFATDPSAEQIARAAPCPNITYSIAAERAPLDAGAADLVSAAMAAHWFDHGRFNAEARRALKPGGVIALWAYGFFRSREPAIDAAINEIAHGAFGPYWQPQNKLIWGGYKDIPFPFDELPAPDVAIAAAHDLPHMLGYLSSWSAAQKFAAQNGAAALKEVYAPLAALWGDPATVRDFSCPLAIRLGRV